VASSWFIIQLLLYVLIWSCKTWNFHFLFNWCRSPSHIRKRIRRMTRNPTVLQTRGCQYKILSSDLAW